MKRIGFLLATAATFVVALALPAFATEGSSLPNRPGAGPGVSGVSGAGGTAFTGANVTGVFLLLIALAVLGAMAMVIGRRRARAAR